MLLTTIANANNKGVLWNDSRTSVSDRWGTTPPMVEIVPAGVTIERHNGKVSGIWKAFPLDPTGRRRAEVPVKIQDSALFLKADPADKSVWYEIVCD